MAEKKVHGRVQFGVNLDDEHHPKIPHSCDTVDGQKYQEERDLQFWGIGEAQERERGPAFVSF